VNGTISIVTRPASDTQGLYATAGAGTEVLDGALSYGRAFGDDSYARVYAKGFDWEPQHNAAGQPEYDDWRLAQTGFRFDASASGGRTLTVSGDAYAGRIGQYLRVTDLAPPYLTVGQEDVDLSGGNVLARLAGPVGASTELELQSYVELTDRNEYPVSEHRRTAEVDLQLRHRRWRSHEINWGLAWQGSWADLDTAPTSSLPEDDEHLLSGFLQDEVSLLNDRVRLTLGTKLEHNQYSGLEVQPGARLAWLVDERSTAWASVTRAVRRPSGVERRYTTTSVLNPGGPAFVRLLPNPDFQSEKLIAYEGGARIGLGERVYVRVSGFYNRWDDLFSTELLPTIQEPAPPNPPRTVIPVTFGNTLHGNSHGAEVVADVRVLPSWTVEGSYSYLRVRVHRDTGSADITQEGLYEGGSPRHQVRLHNSFDLPRGVSVDWHLRYVGELPNYEIGAYTTSDVRIGWQMNDALQLFVVGYSLHDAHHVEWPPDNSGGQVEIERRFRAGLTWRR
jgi:iron complex outermembrane receptor protein